jgi:glutathionyl-hydroquinone reductase
VRDNRPSLSRQYGRDRAEIDALNERVYQPVNNGTYQVAGATTEAD